MDGSHILIIGANGQLGTALQAQYPQAAAVGSEQLDITNVEAVTNFDWSDVEVIINAAAYTNVDGGETTEGRVAAWKANAQGTAHLAHAAIQHDLTLVHVSSDYVFDGSQAPHAETEPFSPLSVYGQTKAAGDIAISLVPKHYILRTSWVIGDGKNFVRTMMSLAEKGVSPTVVGDQIGRLTFTTTLVEAIDYLLSKQAMWGTYNVTDGGEAVSWADITRAIFAELKREDLTVTDTTTAEYFAGKPGVAPRPLRSTLDLSKIKATGFAPRDWRENLKDYIEKELSND